MWQKFLEGLMSALAFVSMPFVSPDLPKGEMVITPSESQESSAETKLQEMQTMMESQQAKINEQEEKIKEFEKSKDVTAEESKQTSLANKKSLACSEANRIQSEIKDNCGIMPYPGIDKCIKSLKERKNDDDFGDKEYREKMSKRLEKVESLKPLYLKNSEICGVEAR